MNFWVLRALHSIESNSVEFLDLTNNYVYMGVAFFYYFPGCHRN